MSSPTRSSPDARSIKARLRLDAVFRFYAVPLRRGGAERRTGVCPSCGPRSRRDAVSVNIEKGLWRCLVCGHGGDAFTAIAAFERLRLPRDFDRAVARAEIILGSEAADVDPVEADAPVDSARAAIARAGRTWSLLALIHPRGVAYLRERGLDTRALIAAGVVRFWNTGEPTVALHDERGFVHGVAIRQLRDDGPKVTSLRGCTTRGTLVGKVTQVRRGSTVVVCEGVTDALASTLLWPDAVVLGAAGAARMPEVAELAARAIVAAGGGHVLLAVDEDDAGIVAGRDAIAAMVAAGLDQRQIAIPPLGGAHDAVAAYAKGWRP